MGHRGVYSQNSLRQSATGVRLRSRPDPIYPALHRDEEGCEMYQGFARMAPLSGRKRRRLKRSALALLPALLLGASISPAGAVVTIGSNLARMPNSRANYSPRPTFINVSLASDRQAPGGLSSPVNG